MFLFPLGGPPYVRDGSLQVLRITHSPHSKVAHARNFAKRVAEYLEATYAGLDAHAYSADLDDPSAIYWVLEYADIATWEAIRAALVSDEAAASAP